MKASILILALLTSASALADSSAQVNDTATINNSGSNYRGNQLINQAAGDQQQQINSRSIAIGTQAATHDNLSQTRSGQLDPSINAKAQILGNSFSNGSGSLGVNQSAGAGNQMINVMRVSISAQPQSMDDSALLQQNVALSNNSGATDPQSGSRQVVTGDQAFTGSRGVTQLNQSAGVGNRMANTLSIRVAD
ncbi:adhesin [Pseudomonas putida]|uniref:adhesin n=1 Tax=Pseudomonas putida TaxID=303 RepID=UPI002363BF7E|nr:adhesin [Pseudomonas putida]MDD2055340.1 adhesin [Pseudomonas putida]